jgi:pimeloyl-ACP methyl ester carboxylesterase
VKASEAIIQKWWRQGMMGGAKAHYDGIVAFSQTDFTDDLKKITVPVLVMHGRRSDRSLCRRWTIVGKAAEERNVENLQGLPPRHADNAGGYDQCRPAGIHESLMLGPWYGR